MNIKSLLKKISLVSITVASAFTLSNCKEEDKKGPERTYFDNENDALVFSTLAADKVFNPFFTTSAVDGNVVGLTQIGMLSNDKNGKVQYGDDVSCITKDLQIVTQGTEDVDQTTTYYFVLKNNVKFSNGSALSMKDVLFNLYVYLDKAYTGSSTIYSTDIVGLKQYRTQEDNENEQDSFDQKFQIIADSRISALIDAAATIFDEHLNEDISVDEFKQYLGEQTSISDTYKNIVNDFTKAVELFTAEIEKDYTNSLDSYEDIKFTDATGTVHSNLLKSDVQAFLYNEGYITWSKKDAKLTCSLARTLEETEKWTKDHAISLILADKVPYDIEEIVSYWGTATELKTYIANQAMEEYFQNDTGRKYKNISGIQFANRENTVNVNGVDYSQPEYDENGNVKSGNEVLSITINGVDPKAIWNFSFGVAPMYYYSDAAHIAKFDYEENFGVEYNSQKFMNEVVKNPDKIGVPVGAGPYAASKSSGGIEGIEAGDFYNLGMIYFERNPHYVMGSPRIKKIRYKVSAANQMLTQLYSGEIDFAEPNSKPETIAELNGKRDQGIENKNIRTAGYGYIGINAGKVPDIKVRQIIMHCINTQECVNYYKTGATAIYRSMSMSSWAYPEDSTPYYPYIGSAIPEDLTVVNPDYAEYVTSLGKSAGDTLTEQEQKDFIKQLVEGSGYTINGNGIYQKGSHQLKYTFTIAGQETDHPAWNALYHAGEVLNKNGFAINVTTDINALSKLSSGDLTVWAAAWGSTIDPDMYQVYHKDSKATSVNNWGYRQILNNAGNKYAVEKALLDDLATLIDAGRKTNDQEQRKQIYANALDLVMQLAVELPTYQRDDLFAFNSNKIDISSLTPYGDCSPYKGLTSDIHMVSLNQEK